MIEVAHEVNECARNGGVKPTDIGKIVETILENRCIQLCPDPYKSMGNRSYRFLGEVKEILFGSTEWEAHLDERVEALDSQAGSQDAVNRSEEPLAREPSRPDVVTDGAEQPGGQIGEASEENIFRLTGEGWWLRYAGEDVSGLKRLRGMSVVQALLRNPSVPGEEPRRLSSSWLDDPDSEPFVDHGEAIFDQQRMEEKKRGSSGFRVGHSGSRGGTGASS